MSDNIFGNPEEKPEQSVSPEGTPSPEASQEQEVKDAQVQDPNSLFADQLQAIQDHTGRQKYADVSTALSSIPHAQARINELSEENKRLQEEVAKKSGIEEVLKHMEESNQNQQEQPSSNMFDETKVSELVSKTLAEREQLALVTSNQEKFKSQLTEKFGDKAETVYLDKAKALGMSLSTLNGLISSSPQAALELFKSVEVPAQNPTTPSINSNALSQNPKETADPLDRFRRGSNDNLDKWRKITNS
jgi:FtsZ-binding cell division protein ZapB